MCTVYTLVTISSLTAGCGIDRRGRSRCFWALVRWIWRRRPPIGSIGRWLPTGPAVWMEAAKLGIVSGPAMCPTGKATKARLCEIVCRALRWKRLLLRIQQHLLVRPVRKLGISWVKVWPSVPSLLLGIVVKGRIKRRRCDGRRPAACWLLMPLLVLRMLLRGLLSPLRRRCRPWPRVPAVVHCLLLPVSSGKNSHAATHSCVFGAPRGRY